MKLYLTERHLEIFDRARIYFKGNDERRLKSGDLLQVPEELRIEPYTTFFRGNTLCSMGSFSFSRSPIQNNSIKIGRYSSISIGVKVMGIDHPIDRFTTSSITYDDRMIMCKKALEDHPNSIFNQQKNSQQSKNRSITTIGNDVWIGEDVTLARGINIGDGSIVASGAIVTKDVEPYTIVGGVPARLIRPRFDSVTVSELMELRFWDYAFWDFGELSLDSGIGYFISHLRKLIEQNSIKKYSPESISLKSLIDFSE